MEKQYLGLIMHFSLGRKNALSKIKWPKKKKKILSRTLKFELVINCAYFERTISQFSF